MCGPPLERRPVMSQNEHWAVSAGMDFRSVEKCESFFRAFSTTCTIFAVFSHKLILTLQTAFIMATV
jgi:hypothetical protein